MDDRLFRLPKAWQRSFEASCEAQLEEQSEESLLLKSQLESKLLSSGKQLGELQNSLEAWRKEVSEQVRGQLESHSAALQKVQTSLVTRMERCQLEVLRKVDLEAEKKVRCEVLDGEVAKELRKLEAKMDREPFEKLSLELQAVTWPCGMDVFELFRADLLINRP